MGEIIIPESRGKKAGVTKIKKRNLRVDMTPMVDLGLLLVSFFILTTELSKPATMNFYASRDGESTKIRSAISMTILLDGNDRAFYYFGITEDAIEKRAIFHTSFNEATGLGAIIRQKQSELEQKNIDRHQLVILIKPGKESSFETTLKALDEMLINDVTRYSLADISQDEEFFSQLISRSLTPIIVNKASMIFHDVPVIM